MKKTAAAATAAVGCRAKGRKKKNRSSSPSTWRRTARQNNIIYRWTRFWIIIIIIIRERYTYARVYEPTNEFRSYIGRCVMCDVWAMCVPYIIRYLESIGRRRRGEETLRVSVVFVFSSKRLLTFPRAYTVRKSLYCNRIFNVGDCAAKERFFRPRWWCVPPTEYLWSGVFSLKISIIFTHLYFKVVKNDKAFENVARNRMFSYFFSSDGKNALS